MNLEKLAAPLDVGRVKTRESGRGAALSYLETHDVIRAANEIFGFGKWGHEVVELRELAPVTVHNRDQKPGTQVGYICTVRLTVEGCVPTSGVGYGDAVEYREAAPVTAHELAAKEAESDALKRALKNFGDQFGLALYDKQAASSGHVTQGSAEPAAAGTNGDSEFRFGSGKHMGKTLAEVPRDYLTWYADNGPRDDVKTAIKVFLTFGKTEMAEDVPF